jgi:hypothetical protein
MYKVPTNLVANHPGCGHYLAVNTLIITIAVITLAIMMSSTDATSFTSAHLCVTIAVATGIRAVSARGWALAHAYLLLLQSVCIHRSQHHRHPR